MEVNDKALQVEMFIQAVTFGGGQLPDLSDPELAPNLRAETEIYKNAPPEAKEDWDAYEKYRGLAPL